jgi:hypothetical protein
MSTRAQIQVEGSKVLVYKHCDGYPDGKHGVLAWLEPFVARFMKHRGFDVDYMTARIVEAGIAKDVVDGDDNGATGWGVDTEIHGDIAYLYTVKPDGSIVVKEM